jgi:hypothetical protein
MSKLKVFKHFLIFTMKTITVTMEKPRKQMICTFEFILFVKTKIKW